MRRIVLCLPVLIALSLSTPLHAKVIHKERSLYRNIIVQEYGDRRCLAFTVKRVERNQSCTSLKNPRRIVFHYVRMLMGALLLNPSPRQVLLVGLGAGTVATVLKELYPDIKIIVVEIDEAVLKVARDFFNFKTDDSLKVSVMDARVYVKRAMKAGESFDLILLDAFTGDYIPEHLMTVEFLQEVKYLLTPDGVIAANTFSTSRLYDHESVTYKKVFQRFFNFKMPNTNNRVIISSRLMADTRRFPRQDLLTRHASELADQLEPYAVKIKMFPVHMQRSEDWNSSVRELTDQYSPANLLR